MTLGAFIRDRRTALSWTQDQLATRVGVGRSSLALWETGRRRPSIDHLRALSDSFALTEAEQSQVMKMATAA